MANEQAQAFIDQATQSLQNSQFQQALELVDQAIAIEPGVSDSHVLRGICLSQLGQPDAATEAFRKAILLSPYNGKAYYNLAVHMNSQGKKKEAIDLAREAVGVDPRHSSARALLTQLEAEVRGDPQAPAGATMSSPPLSNDPLAAAPPSSGPAPTAPPAASGGVIEPDLPPRNQPAPPMSRPEGPGAPPSSGPQAPVGSPYSANYQRGGYVASAHSIPWVENLEPGWTIIGWVLTALSFIILMAAIGTVWSAVQAVMTHGPNAAAGGPGIGLTTPLGVIGLIIRLLCLLWIIIDVVDRKTSWFWVVVLVVLGCCCASPWLILPFYIGLGRKGSN